MNQKKILLLNYEFPPLGGGASPVSYELAKQLSETGNFDIDVVTMGYKDLPIYEEVNKNFRIHRVKCLRSKKEICHPWEQATYLFFAWFKCKQLLKQTSYDLCHAHFIIPTGVLALKLKEKFGLPYIITSHGSDVLGYNPRFKKIYPLLINIWKKILNNSEKISTPSRFLKREISKAYPELDENKIYVIPNGIEVGKFVPMQKQKYILLVSRLTVNKGIQDFIEAVKEIDLQEWNVKIVGEGPYKNNLEELVRRYNLQKKVKFLGWVDNKSEQMKELYGKASIFVLPSWFENMNMTLLEAMQAGCKILATNVGGNPEIVTPDSLVERGDKNDFKQKILKAINNNVSNLNLDFKRYLWSNIYSQYNQFYEKN